MLPPAAGYERRFGDIEAVISLGVAAAYERCTIWWRNLFLLLAIMVEKSTAEPGKTNEGTSMFEGGESSMNRRPGKEPMDLHEEFLRRLASNELRTKHKHDPSRHPRYDAEGDFDGDVVAAEKRAKHNHDRPQPNKPQPPQQNDRSNYNSLNTRCALRTFVEIILSLNDIQKHATSEGNGVWFTVRNEN